MLTDLAIKQTKPKPQRFEVTDNTRPGFRLAVFPSGARSFVYRYSFGGKYRKLTLGGYPAMGFAAALDAYRAAADTLAHGRDPGAAKIAARTAVAPDDTVTAYAEQYRTLHLPTLAAGTRKQIDAELDRMVDAIGNRDLASITAADVQRLIDAALVRGIAARNTTYKRLRAFLTWATGRAGIENPAAKIKRPSNDTIRDRVLDDAEIKTVWKAAEAAEGAPGALVKLLLLTGMRRAEVTHLRRAEVRANTIELPGERTKNGHPHSVPITWLVRRVLDGLQADQDTVRDARAREAKALDAEHPQDGTDKQPSKYVLTGNGAGLGGHSKARTKIKTPDLEPWTFHDLRRTFATGLARLKVPLEVTEKCLNHISGVSHDPLVRTYQKHEHATEIVEAFNKWSDHVAELVGEKRDQLTT